MTTPDLAVTDIATPHGPARLHAAEPGGAPRAVVLLGHGAGGGVAAADLRLVAGVALELGCVAGLVEQPYRVAGRRAPAPAAQVDAAWEAVVAQARARWPQAPLVSGGRSSGARVACRTAAATGARGVLCLAFPTHPPGRPERSRQPELDAVEVPVLVVQGRSDAFGTPDPTPSTTLVRVAGDHSLTKDHPQIADAVRAWLVALPTG